MNSYGLYLQYLWKKNPEKLLRKLIELGYEVIITSVKADGFSEEWLGRRIDESCLNDLLKLNRKYKIHLMGEGGEYETFVLDGPIFKKRLEIVKSSIIEEGLVCQLVIEEMSVKSKNLKV